MRSNPAFQKAITDSGTPTAHWLQEWQYRNGYVVWSGTWDDETPREKWLYVYRDDRQFQKWWHVFSPSGDELYNTPYLRTALGFIDTVFHFNEHRDLAEWYDRKNDWQRWGDARNRMDEERKKKLSPPVSEADVDERLVPLMRIIRVEVHDE